MRPISGSLLISLSIERKFMRRRLITFLIAVFCWLCFSLPSLAAASDEAKVLHVLNRLGFGPSPSALEQIRSIGIEAYIEAQLHPETIPEPADLTDRLNQLTTLQLSPTELLRQYRVLPTADNPDPENPKGLLPLDQATQAKLLRAIASPRQLEEAMVDFWYNHFNVALDKGLDRYWVGAYEREAIRPYTLGKFRDLLGATAQHPAMLFYLDNWVNGISPRAARRGEFDEVNENYAREVMELHTLGVGGGYTEADIITLARIFTGWGFCKPRQFEDASFCFNPKRHDPSDKVFLGEAIPGGGIEEGERALDILARRPATARYISYRLAQYFVADRPPDLLVNRLANTFQTTDGDIRAVLKTLVDSPEFWEPQGMGQKFKSPYQYMVSAVRASGLAVKNPRPIGGVLQQLGMRLYGCPSPDGYKNTQEVWLSPYAITRRLDWISILAAGRLPLLSDPPPLGERPSRPQPEPIAYQPLLDTLGSSLSPETQQRVAGASPRLRAAAVLGSPEFMYR